MMAKRLTLAHLTCGAAAVPESSWLIAHDLRNDLMAALLRLRLLEKHEPRGHMRAAADLVRAAIDRLEDQEEQAIDVEIAASAGDPGTNRRGQPPADRSRPRRARSEGVARRPGTKSVRGDSNEKGVSIGANDENGGRHQNWSGRRDGHNSPEGRAQAHHAPSMHRSEGSAAATSAHDARK
jgi:hypothetical protein